MGYLCEYVQEPGVEMIELSVDEIKRLRELGLLQANETAFRSGDLIVAQNVINSSKRILEGVDTTMLESKRLLKG
jgi:hypothetical protein